MEAINYFKCKGCKCRRAENDFEVLKGLRRLTCLICKAKHEKNKCEHGRQKSQCKDCGGSQICEHNRQKSKCKDCGGNQICEHNRQKSKCKVCSPQQVLVNLVRTQVVRAFKNSTLSKINHSITYLGCDTETLKKHIQAKMIEGMTIDNIHYDHIKPISRFDLNDEEELLKCCHFTNLQPLFAVDNLEKNNKWTAENEVYWNENIIYKPDFCVIYK